MAIKTTKKPTKKITKKPVVKSKTTKRSPRVGKKTTG